MKINKSSWHFRLLRAFDYWPEDNLCGYIQQLIKATIQSIITFCIFAGALISVVLPIYLAIFQIGVHWVIFGLFSSLYLLYGVAAIMAYRDLGLSGGIWHTPLFKASKRTKEESLMSAYIRAKKQKICPRIEFVE